MATAEALFVSFLFLFFWGEGRLSKKIVIYSDSDLWSLLEDPAPELIWVLQRAIAQYCHVVLPAEVLTFKFVDETQVCDHSNESYWEVL